MLNGSFKYCSLTCHNLKTKHLNKKSELIKNKGIFAEYIENEQTQLNSSPSYINIAYDYSCNLACPSCRKQKKTANKEKPKELDGALNRAILPMLRDTNILQFEISFNEISRRIF